MESIKDAVVEVTYYLCGMPVLYAASIVSMILIISTKGFVFRYFGHILCTIAGGFRKKKDSDRGISSFSACCTALGNTLGVGNIAGIAIALASGGPGALFWIWVAGLLGVVIKYSEVVLGSHYRGVDEQTGMYQGGIMYYIERGLGKRWKWLAVLYALVYGSMSFVVEAMQINSVVGAFEGGIQFPPIIVGIAGSVFIGFVLLGGIRRLSDISNKLIPFLALLYIGVSVLILLTNITRIPGVLQDVMVSAFTGSAAAGGFAGATASMAIRYGIMRGFYSNGAATGDVAFAHSSANVAHPVHQGMWGVMEVVVDTIVCSGTALTILTTGVLDTGLTGTALTTKAFSVFFGDDRLGSLFIGGVVALFAYTTAMVGAYYGEVCIKYLVGNRRMSRYLLIAYRCAICISALAGSVASLELLWSFSDIALAICMFICMGALLMCRRQIASLTEDYKKSMADRQKLLIKIKE